MGQGKTKMCKVRGAETRAVTQVDRVPPGDGGASPIPPRIAALVVPRMGETALVIEIGVHRFLSNFAIVMGITLYASGGKGTGIIVARDKHGRVFKIEISQVEGPQ